jgi:hypothetical protein
VFCSYYGFKGEKGGEAEGDIGGEGKETRTHSSRRTQLQLVNTSPMGTFLPTGSGGNSLESKLGSSRAAV